MRTRGQNPLARLVYAIGGLISGLLIIRLVLRFFGANPANSLVAWIYNVSQPLVRPFFGIFNTPLAATLDHAHLEVPTLVALVAFAVIAWVLAGILATLG